MTSAASDGRNEASDPTGGGEMGGVGMLSVTALLIGSPLVEARQSLTAHSKSPPIDPPGASQQSPWLFGCAPFQPFTPLSVPPFLLSSCFTVHASHLQEEEVEESWVSADL